MPSMVFYRVSCFSGDLWSRGVFQHFTASHHFPRWIQFETGKDVLQICKYDLTGQFIILVLLVWVDRLGFRIYLILRGTCFTKNVDISTLTWWCNMIREMHVVHCGYVKKSHCQQQYSKLCFFFLNGGHWLLNDSQLLLKHMLKTVSSCLNALSCSHLQILTIPSR